MALLLQAVEVAGPSRWRWLLSDERTSAPLADHQVDLGLVPDEVVRFSDLYTYVRWHAAPDRRTADESRIVAQAGAWAGHVLLGERVGTAIAEAAPVTVRVSVPDEVGFVLFWPLELAHVRGEPLAARGDVTFVYGVAGNTGRVKDEVSGALRMLAVFSLPTETSVLALRRERHALRRLIRQIAARQQRLVELQVVQYGVTRQRLEKIVDSGDSWDVLHLSGHGGRGLFLLEHADGSPDPVEVADLVRLLRPARRRVKLAVVSACQSAADVTAETLRLVGLHDQAGQLEESDAAEPAGATAGIARALAESLDCAVVAMRYPVTDGFAIAFGAEFYERLLGRGQPVDVAAARAVAVAAGVVPSAALPPLSLATPGVFGSRAAGLKLPAPRGAPLLDLAKAKLAFFPDEPERFVGRARAMALASTALAPASGRTTVLLHGMAGAGKTACAVELAYRHQDSFAAAAFWQAPSRDDEFAGALPNLAAALEIQLGDYGFRMTGHISTVTALQRFLPRLRRVLEDNGVLLVLDNLETLLTPEGTWRDPRWGPLVAALTGHSGESRLIMTSRIPLADLGEQVLALPVHALSLDEAAALARELPNLRDRLHAIPRLVHGVSPNAARDRERVRRVLRVVQGHPKLLELADAAAADPFQLDALLTAAETAAAGQGLDTFFRSGTSTLDPGQFLAALTTWTATALTTLSPPARLMAEFLACLEDDDRRSDIIESNWEDLWRRLEIAGDPPEPGLLLDTLATAALIQPESLDTPRDSVGQPENRPSPPPVGYQVHPGVAAAILAAAPEVGAAADAELADFWQAVAYQAKEEQESGEDSALIVHAGLAAAPYLLRRHDWGTASTLLEQAVIRDKSPEVIQSALPALRHITAATRAPADYAILGNALRTVDPAEAETLLRDALHAITETGDYRLASGIAGDLVSLLRDTGRLGEALDLTGQVAAYTRQAGLGPWTELSDQGQRLQILALMGEHQQVLTETDDLRTRMAQLPSRSTVSDTASPWNVREGILDTAHTSALALGQWQQCLELNAEILASKHQRDANPHEIASTRWHDAWPLIELGRLEEAGQLLRDCQQVFENHRDTAGLARILSARAALQDRLGHLGTSVDFEQTALRLSYARPDPRQIASCHDNLAFYLRKTGSDPGGQRAHRLAAALIYQLTGMTRDLVSAQRGLAAELREDTGGGAGAEHSPASLTEVIRIAEQTDGVHLSELLTALQTDAQTAEDALTQILHTAADLLSGDETGAASYPQEWEAYIAAIAAVGHGDQEIAAQLIPALDDVAENPDWSAVVGVLRRILNGERGDELLDGLDAIDAAIVRETLTRITEPG